MTHSNSPSQAQTIYNPPFSRIYVEREAAEYPLAKQILARFPGADVVEIEHYKDVFNRSHQSFYHQKQAQALILAVKKGTLIYPGAPVCQNFGNRHFYYTSNIMNCIYDCEYCYLQGMYPSGNLVVFLNQEDIFSQAELLLKEHPVYLCVSYDTDLLALEGVTGFTRNWIAFAESHPDLTIEIRTKSAGFAAISDMTPSKRAILAWTISPDAAALLCEHRAPSVGVRLQSAKAALDMGWPVRLCFDPLLMLPDAAKLYREFVEEVFRLLPAERILDVSVGPFRISAEYLKQIRKSRPASALLSYPFEIHGGVASYNREACAALMNYVYGLLTEHVKPEQIFRYEEE